MSIAPNRADHDDISAEWARIGGGFTVAPAPSPVDVEDLLVRSAIRSPSDHRLFFVAATWLGVHHHLVDMRRLGRMLDGVTGLASAVAGALLSVAGEVAGSSRLKVAARHCRPLTEPRVLFERTAAHPVLSTFARGKALPVFAQWGLWHDELSLKHGAVRPVRWILEHCPELRIRALIGANLDGEIIGALRGEPRTVANLARVAGASYAATHEAASRLIARGLVVPGEQGKRTGLAIPDTVAAWLESFSEPRMLAPSERRGYAGP